MQNELLNEEKENKYLIIKSAFNKYENSIYKMNEKYNGYLINLEEYENIKEKIGYDKDIHNINQNNSDCINYLNIKQIEYKTYYYLLNMIFNGNEYIIINEELWKILNKKEEEDQDPIEFMINNNKITVYLGDNKNLNFSYSKNEKIILKKSLLEKDNLDYTNYNIIIPFYENIEKYYNFEKEFLKDLSEPNSKQKVYCLITKKWLDQWMEYSHYEEFKDLFSENQINGKKIKNKIIYILEKEKYRYKNLLLDDNEIIKITKINQLEYYLKANPLVLIDKLFLSSFQKNSVATTKIVVYNNKIEFTLNDGELIMYSKNNIISSNLYDNKIDININKKEGKNNIKDEKEDQKSNLYLYYSIFLCNEYSKLNKQKVNCGGNNFLLINRDLMETIEVILNFVKVNIIINYEKQNNQFDFNFQNGNDDYNNIIINKVKQLLEDYNAKFYIYGKSEISKFFQNESMLSLYKKPYQSKNGNIFYCYYNCQLITKEILAFINEKFKMNIKPFGCYLKGENIIYFDDKNYLNIGFLDKNNLFIVKHIIYSQKKEKLIAILSNFLNKEYKEFEMELQNKDFKKDIIINTIKAKKKDPYKMSNILNTLILLFINNQDNYREKIKDMENQKVFLLNRKWLDNYLLEFNLIKNLFRDKDFNGKEIDKIISELNVEELKEIDDILSKKESSKFSIIPLLKLIKLKNEKIKIINQDFIFVVQEIYNKIKNNFGQLKEEIFYLYNKNIDIFLIEKEKEKQYIILLGNIDDKNNIFNIKYILSFANNNYYLKEKNIILKIDDIDNYIKEKTIFNEELKEVFISPIFERGELIGLCYKYNQNIDYNSCQNYYDLLFSSTKLINSIDIYFNYQRISQKILRKENDPATEKYYIINKELISNIKIDIEFKTIYDIMNISCIQENDIYWKQKFLISAIKNLSNEDLEKYKKKRASQYLGSFDPTMIIVKYLNESIFLYNTFEIIQKEVIEKILDKNCILNNYYLECIINENKIIINYPENSNEKKYVTVIGKLEDYDKTFITEYILIFENKDKQKNYINKIKGCLDIILESLEFNNNILIIEENSVQEVIIIKYDPNNSEFVNNPSSNQINTNGIDDWNNANIKEEHINRFYTENKIDKDMSNKLNSNFKISPKIGLQNIGATCYMNSTLQCFCHIKKLVEYFKYNSNIIEFVNKDKENKSLTSSFKLLIENLWPKVIINKYYAPEDFKKKISVLNSLFEGIAANDAKDLVNFIIMKLHEELNQVKNKSDSNNNNLFYDQTNQISMYNNFKTDFEKNNNSIISDLFYSTNCNLTKCNFCNKIIYNYQIYFFLVFPLEEVRKFKINNSNNNMINSCVNFNYNMINNFNINNNFNNNMINSLNINNNFYNNLNYNCSYNTNLNNGNTSYNNYNLNNNFSTDTVSLFDCFEYSQKINLMSGENQMFCNFCRKNNDCCMQTILIDGPEILILLLNRGKGIEFNVKILFDEYLNLSQFFQNDTKFNYKLIGVITHIGESSMSGHFIAYCRDPIDDKSWIKYNDSLVSDVIDFQKEVIDFAMPYLLFYQKI